MPDLQYAASHSDTMVGLRDHILSRRCMISPSSPGTSLTFCFPDDKVKNYNINTAAGADFTKTVGPSAEFLQMPIAFNYRYGSSSADPTFTNCWLVSSKTPTSNTLTKVLSMCREVCLTTHTPLSNPPTSMCQLDRDPTYPQRGISRLICSR